MDTKTLLANRIQIAAKAVDHFRADALNAHRPDDFLRIARGLDQSLAVLEELERIWEALYGEKPTMHDIYDTLSGVV